MENQTRVIKLKELNCQAKSMLASEFNKLLDEWDRQNYINYRELLSESYRHVLDYYNLSVFFPQQKIWQKRLKDSEKEFNKLLKQQNKILVKLTKINKQRRLLRITKPNKQLKINF
jgi:hypothetical protein